MDVIVLRIFIRLLKLHVDSVYLTSNMIMKYTYHYYTLDYVLLILL